MKKLSKILALSMALALTFGMTVFAAPSAGTLNSWADGVKESATVEGEWGDDEVPEVTIDAVETSTIEGLETALEGGDEELIDAVMKELNVSETDDVDVSFEVVWAADIDVEGVTGEVTLTFTVDPAFLPALEDNQKYLVLHLDNGKWVVVEGASVNPETGEVTITSDSFSPFVIGVAEVAEVPEGGNTGNNNQGGGNNNQGGGNNNAAPAPAPAAAQPTAPQTGETVPVAGFVALILLAGAAVCAKKAQFNN